MTAKVKNWDVIVVGGGMVGTTCALCCAKLGLKVLLLERSPIDLNWTAQSVAEIRVSALTRVTENILRNLSAWEGIESKRLHPFTAMHVWEQNSEAYVHFSADDIGEDNLGHVVENRVIQLALWEQVQKCPNIEVMFDQSLESFEYSTKTGLASLKLASGKILYAQLVIGADGANSITRKLANIGLSQHDYGMCTVVGNVRTERSHQDTCWQRYTTDGPFAYLSMEDNLSSIAWYLPIEKMQWALELDELSFKQALFEASGGCLGEVVDVFERGAFPLVRRHAVHYVKPGVALIGDSAHTINPQAGQGVNLGFLDAAQLVETLKTGLSKNIELGNEGLLRKYERQRKGDNVLVQRSMEGFDWFFEQNDNVKSFLRPKLMRTLQSSTVMKNWMTRKSLKGRGDLPDLARV